MWYVNGEQKKPKKNQQKRNDHVTHAVWSEALQRRKTTYTHMNEIYINEKKTSVGFWLHSEGN